MKKDEALKLANAKIEHEHSRWNTWAIFFFGSIISVFTVWSQFKDIIPSYVPCIMGALISFIWVFVALGTRRVSASWVKVIKYIEASNSDDFKPNKLYKQYEGEHSICEDFFDFSLFRVTKVLTYAGIVSFMIFIVLGLILLNNPTKKANQTLEIKNLTKLIDSIHTHTQQAHNIHQRILAIESKLDNIERKVEEYNKANSDDAKSRAAD